MNGKIQVWEHQRNQRYYRLVHATDDLLEAFEYVSEHSKSADSLGFKVMHEGHLLAGGGDSIEQALDELLVSNHGSFRIKGKIVRKLTDSSDNDYYRWNGEMYDHADNLLDEAYGEGAGDVTLATQRWCREHTREEEGK